jgi:hypothetical protein
MIIGPCLRPLELWNILFATISGTRSSMVDEIRLIVGDAETKSKSYWNMLGFREMANCLLAMEVAIRLLSHQTLDKLSTSSSVAPEQRQVNSSVKRGNISASGIFILFLRRVHMNKTLATEHFAVNSFHFVT